MRKSAFLFAASLAALAACGNPEACLASSSAFAGARSDVVHDCCVCLAGNGTRHPGAACAEAFIDVNVDGGFAVFADSGPPPRGVESIPVKRCERDDQCARGLKCTGLFGQTGICEAPDDTDGSVEPDEVPCLCQDSEAQCEQVLNAADPNNGLLVTGSCIAHSTGLFENPPPCASACQGVTDFIPLETGP